MINEEFNQNIQIPKTIVELQQWYRDRNLPDENVTRFFIGKNYTNPKAFGIYKNEENGNFIVYKNKSNGERAIHYEGPDEEYAVNELYLKLKEEIANQKSRIEQTQKYSEQYNNPYSKKSSNKLNLKVGSIIAIIVCTIIGFNIFLPNRGYYYYNNSYYYYQNGSWYIYNYGWRETTPPKELKKNHSKYYKSSYYRSYYIDSFEDSIYYIRPSSSSDSYSDSSSDWDSGSDWDSSFTDWDSDW